MKYSKTKKSNVSKKVSYRNKNWVTKYVPRPLAINRGAPGFSSSLKTRLETSFFYNATAAGSGVFTGNLNPGSCFDPTGSLADIQPVTFDQLKLIYARYLVTSGYVSIEVCSLRDQVAGNGIPSFVFVAWPSTVVTAAATYQGAASQPFSKEVMCSSSESKSLYIPFNAQKIVGSRLPVTSEDHGALIGANPATGQNVIVNMFYQSAISQADSVVLRIRIVQDVIFDQRIAVVDA